jgi:hypothetical protein
MAVMQAHPIVMGSRFRAWVERVLPWYDPITEHLRDLRTEQRRRRTISALHQAERAEQVIDDYRDADRAARHER